MSDTPDRGTDPKPRTPRRFPPTGVASIISVIVFVLLLLAVAVGLILRLVA